MRGDSYPSMMPMAPIATMPLHPSPKPKLGFSIESIVGREKTRDKISPSKSDDERNSDGERTPRTPPPAHTQQTGPPYYRTSNLSGYPGLHSPRSENLEYGVRTNFMPPSSAGNAAVMGFHHPSVITPYATDALSAMSLGPCQPQYPLSPYFIGREYPSYPPWLMARQPRLLPYRPQGPQSASFILHQFRKPKRIRTAFSPSQLLTLEHAFEKNHYVVGAERKQLAQDLHLTETQVKVWFQNRRTKHKRQKQEEEQQSQPSEGRQNNDEDHLQMTSVEIKDDSEESDCDSRDSCEVTQHTPT